ncbi:head-tail connector protein [Lonepinella sp. BR2904]|uniref:head-tail connector protein n=1 Tax=Lonepinella sp. BR2904 TaxID=3434551 RepID=UPI003F6E3BB1
METTSTDLISIQEAKAHLNLMDDFTLDDSLLTGFINVSIEVAQKHIGKVFGEQETDLTIPFYPAIKVGCLMYIAHLYTNREITTDTAQTIIPMTISSLWNVYREPCIY